MDILKVNKEILEFVFNRLRKQEGNKVRNVTINMDSLLIFKILVNARYKQEHQITLTDLESSVRNEVGDYIKMYVAQKFEDAKLETTFTSLPYEELANKTLKDFERVSKKSKIVMCGRTA